jgi:hypothetical protein
METFTSMLLHPFVLVYLSSNEFIDFFMFFLLFHRHSPPKMILATEQELHLDIDFFSYVLVPCVNVPVSEYVKPISQCRLERACIK